MQWVQSAFEVSAGQVVAIDGKQLRRSHDKGLGKAAIYMVSAWAADNHLTLGQRKVDDKSNEITAIPKLLEVLSLAGCIVTFDAMGCQKEIAQAILDKDADHGRIDIRECWTVSDPTQFPYFRTSQQWPGLRTLVKVRRERQLPDKTTVEISYYIASLSKPAAPLLDAMRAHWQIENGLRLCI